MKTIPGQPYHSFANQNHRVNGAVIEKVASVYDTVSVSNRKASPDLQLNTLSPHDNEQLRLQIQKEALAVDGSELIKGASAIDKTAFLSGGMDLFTSVKGLLRNKLGVPDETSHELASPIITQALKIQEQYGGDEKKIAERLITEMQGQLTDNSPNPDHTLGGVQSVMAVVGTKGLEEQIKQRLIEETGLNSYEADRLKKSVVGEARDIAGMIRPHKMDAIAGAIVSFVAQHGDPGVVYGLKDSPAHVQEIRSMLESETTT